MTQKEIATDFLYATARGESRKVFEKYVSPNFIHHNAFFKGDADSLMMAMEENAKRFPGIIVNIQRLVEEGNIVAAHSHIQLNPGDSGLAVMHIFRFENNKIAELWDFGQQVPADMINENGMF